MRKLFLHTSRWTLRLLITLVIAAGLLLGAARLTLPPLLAAWEQELQVWLRDQVGDQLRIGELRLSWEGWQLGLLVRDLSLAGDDGEAPGLELSRVFLGFDLPAMIATGELAWSRIIAENGHLNLQRLQNGILQIRGFDTAPASALAIDPVGLLGLLGGIESLRATGLAVDLYESPGAAPPARYRNIELRLANQDLEHWAAISMDLPDELGGRLDLRGRGSGRLTDFQNLSSKLYLRLVGANIDAAPWRDSMPRPLSGVADLELWGSLQGIELTRLEGKIEARDIAVGSVDGSGIDLLSTQFLATPEQGDWRLQMDHLTVDSGPSRWRLPGAYIRARRGQDQQLRSLQIELAELPLEMAAVFANVSGQLPQRWQDWLQAARPRGSVRDLRLGWLRGGGGLGKDTVMSAAFENIGIDAVGKMPGGSGLSGRLRLRGERLDLTLDSQDASVTLPTLFRDPLPLVSVEGPLTLERNDGVWQFQTSDLRVISPDIETRSRVDLRWYGDTRPSFMDLQVFFRDGDGSQTSRYLPVGIMKPVLVEWLDRAIVDAHVTSGGVLLRGPLRRFPFNDHSGTFLVAFGIDDAILDFDPKWPRAAEMAADITFRGAGMEAVASSAKLSALEAIDTRVAIPELLEPVLSLTSTTNADLRDMLQFVQASPLTDSLGAQLEPLNLSGASELQLDLQLPLKTLQPRIRGQVRTADAALELRQWHLPLTNVSGEVGFSELGADAGRLTANLRGGTVSAEISGRSTGNSYTTVLAARGALSLVPWMKQFGYDFSQYLAGSSAWQARIEWDNQRPGLRVALDSDLRGVDVKLPAPVGKQAGAARQLRIEARSSDAGVVEVEASYAPQMQLIAQLGGNPDSPQLQRAALRFGPGAAELPGQAGVAVDGTLTELDIDAWRLRLPGTGLAYPGWLRSVNLDVGKVTVGGHMVSEVAIDADTKDWSVVIGDPDFNGSIKGSVPLTETVVRGQFQNVVLRSESPVAPPADGAADASTDWPDPSTLPLLQLDIENLRFEDAPGGRLRLLTRRLPDGLEIEELKLTGQQFVLEAGGSWTQRDDGSQRSALSLNLEAEDMGAALRDLDIYAAIDGAEGSMRMKGKWLGALPAPDLASLNGDMSIELGKGRFLEVDPGAGRVVGLFTLSGLVRRLSLDFSDLFEKGFSFDSIVGELDFSAGDAYIRELQVDGPVARLRIDGRVGLVAQDYDQQVQVFPAVGASLPLAGLIAAGPVGGAAGFLASQVLGRSIDEANKVEYTITGSWSDPIITLVPRIKQPEAWQDQPGDS